MSENESDVECRACLSSFDPSSGRNIFLPWCAPWSQFGSTIAYDLARVTNVEISDTDHHPHMCEPCCLQLYKACEFIDIVQKNAEIIQKRTQSGSANSLTNTFQCDAEKTWPKPIQLETSINGDMFRGSVDVEIKQEVLSDEDVSNGLGGNRDSLLDIKVETEENMPSPAKIKARGTVPAQLSHGKELYENEEYLEHPLKAEPWSDEEMEQAAGDLSLDCMLCMKSFHSISGLKAHVIAQHTYKTVKRKAEPNSSPVKQPSKHVCATCRRTFSTPTDLMVHETCHNKSVCYGCNQKFDSFDQLRKHRRRCKAVKAHKPRTKTLEDAIRAPHKPPLKCKSCDATFSDIYYMNIHNEIHHNSQAKSDQTNIEIEETKRQNGDDKVELNEASEGKEFENELLEHLLGHENIEQLSERMIENEKDNEKKEQSISASEQMHVEQSNDSKSKDDSQHKNNEQNNEDINKDNKTLERDEEQMEVEDDYPSKEQKDVNEINEGKGPTALMQINIQEELKDIQDNLLNEAKDIDYQMNDIANSVIEDLKDIPHKKVMNLEAMKDAQLGEVQVTNFEGIIHHPEEIQGILVEKGVEDKFEQDNMENNEDQLHQINDTCSDVMTDGQPEGDTLNKEVPDNEITELHVNLNVESVQEGIKEEATHTEMDVSSKLDALIQADEGIFVKTEDTIQKIEIELLPTVLEDGNI